MVQDVKNIENCWKRIGVWGKEEKLTCPELKRVIHCRNCEVFIRAGRNLLERDLPGDYKNEWTQLLTEKKGDEALLGTTSVAIFRIEGEWLALSAHLLEEVIDPQKIHSIPHRDTSILLGVINVHGEIQLCVSLRELLGLEKCNNEEKDRNPYKRMIAVNREGNKWVFPVDEIHGIYRVRHKTFQNVPVTVAKAKSAFTKAIFMWEDKRVAFLDDELLLYSLTRSVK